MPNLTIDIDTQIQELDDRWTELSNMSVNPLGANPQDNDNRRVQITFWKSQILLQKHILDDIKSNKQAAQVTVTSLTQAQIDQAQSAMAVLNKVIQADQAFQNVVNSVTTLLNATNTVGSTASKS